MGWSSGAELAEKVYKRVRAYIPIDKRKEVARNFYDLFSDSDADTWEDAPLLCSDGKFQELWD
jgi:hypothetical protein